MADVLSMFNAPVTSGKVATAPEAVLPPDFAAQAARLLAIREQLATLTAAEKALAAEVKGPLAEAVYAQCARSGKITLSAAAAGVILSLQRRAKLTPEQAAAVAAVLPADATEDASTWEVNVGALAALPAETLRQLAAAGVLSRKPALALTDTGWAAYFTRPDVRARCEAAGIAPVAVLKADPKHVPDTVIVDGQSVEVTWEKGGGK